MSPNQEAEHRNPQAGECNEVISENMLPRKAEISSLMMPMPGRIMMYTAGCE